MVPFRRGLFTLFSYRVRNQFLDSTRQKFLGILILLLHWGQILPAQDRVTFQLDGSTGTVVGVGEIVDYTGRQLTLRTVNGTQQIPTTSISGIETHYSAAQLRGTAEFAQFETLSAQNSFREALKQEPREWVQRDLRAYLVKCALRQQDLIGALQEFREIALKDPQTRHWGIAPLIWYPMNISQVLRTELQPWLTSPREAERMLAASVLLLDPVLGERAEEQLQSLSRDTNPVLAAYGKCQLWRLVVASRNVSDVTLENWRQEIQRLPPALRGGPQYLLSRGYEVRGESRLAAAEALWIPYVYHETESLAARAMSDAVEQLERAGQNAEARQVALELLTRYPWSPEAARQRAAQQQASGKKQD